MLSLQCHISCGTLTVQLFTLPYLLCKKILCCAIFAAACFPYSILKVRKESKDYILPTNYSSLTISDSSFLITSMTLYTVHDLSLRDYIVYPISLYPWPTVLPHDRWLLNYWINSLTCFFMTLYTMTWMLYDLLAWCYSHDPLLSAQWPVASS